MSIGTRLFTLLRGRSVGKDRFGNRYYESRGLAPNGRTRRWVLYKGEPEASSVPPEWHGWIHHGADNPLPEQPKHAWMREHEPNLTGTPDAYRPRGHELQGGQRARATGDYEPWTPG